MKEKKQILNYSVLLLTMLFISSTTLFPLRESTKLWFEIMEEVYYVNPPWVFDLKYVVYRFCEDHPYILIYRSPMATSHLILCFFLTGVIINPIRIQFIIAISLIATIIILPLFYLNIIAKIPLHDILTDYILALIILIMFYKINSLINQLKLKP